MVKPIGRGASKFAPKTQLPDKRLKVRLMIDDDYINEQLGVMSLKNDR